MSSTYFLIGKVKNENFQRFETLSEVELYLPLEETESMNWKKECDLEVSYHVFI
jgi:hypothetical protein